MDYTNLDYILLIVVLGFGMIGYVKGAINTLIGFLGMIASFIIAGIFSPIISSWIVDSGPVQSYLSGTVATGILDDMGRYSAEALEQLQNSAVLSGLREPLETALTGGAEAQSAVTAALTPVAYQLVHGLSFIILLVFVGIIIAVIKRAGAGLNHVPVIGFANRLLGGVIGLVMGMALAGIVTAAVLYTGIFTGNMDLIQMVENGRITGEMLGVLSAGGIL